MSLWKFGDFEAEVDFLDADFLDKLENAKKEMNDHLRLVPKVGRNTDIIRAQVNCYLAFYDALFGNGAGSAITSGRMSLKVCLEATDSLLAFEKKSSGDIENKYGKYMVQNHGNRKQRRDFQKRQNRQGRADG